MAATIEQLLRTWLDDLATLDRAAQTRKRYASAIQGFLGWYALQEQRTLDLKDLTPMTLVGYRTALQQTSAPSTVNVHLCALRAWGEWLVQHHYLEANPAARLKLVDRVERDAPAYLSDSEVNALLRAAQRSRHAARDYAMMQVLLQTGMRIGECQALGWQDITFAEKSGSVSVRAGKGNKARTIPLNGSARTALARYVAPRLGTQDTLKAVAHAWPPHTASPLWQSQKTTQLTLTAIWRVVHTLVRECALRALVPPQVTPHWLRHTFAHRYLTQYPGDLVGLARLLGHRDLNTTKVYTQPTAAELARRLDQFALNAYQ